MELAVYRKYSFLIYSSFFLLFYIILIFQIEPFNTYSKSFGLIGNLMCFPLFWKGLKYHNIDQRKPWIYFTVAAFIYFIGEAVYAYYTDVLGAEPKTPSVCDIFYFINLCLSFTGLFYYLKLTQRTDLKSISFDMLISVFAAGGLIYNFIMLPLFSEGVASDLFMIIAQLYNPVFEFALLTGLLLFLFGTNNQQFFTPTNILIGIAFLFSFSMDQLSLMINLYNIDLGLMLDPLWTLYYMLLSFASLYPETEVKPETQGNKHYLNIALGYFRILLPYIFTFMILFFVGLEYKIMTSLFIWAMLLVVLLSLRQIFVLIGNKKLMETIRRNEEKLNMQNSELQKLNAKIMHDAEVDFLTQLYNRRCIDKSFERLVPQDNQVQSLGILLIDVDLFKKINDTFGHQIGDEVLQKVASAFRSVIRGNDIAGRFGGDEFIVLLPGADILITESITRNLIEKVHKDHLLRKYKVTLSIGCTSCKVNSQNYSVKNILKQADDALYKAKERGRNQYVVGLPGGIAWGDR